MSEPEVRVVQIPAMRVASFHGFGTSPENEALEKMKAWAELKGYYQDRKEHRVFGFDNPPPSPGSPNYGYEVWMAIAADEPESEGVEFKDFTGGLYGVLRVEVKEPWVDIPAAWDQLIRWLEGSRYHNGSHQHLEEHLVLANSPTGGFVLDLHIPIAE